MRIFLDWIFKACRLNRNKLVRKVGFWWHKSQESWDTGDIFLAYSKSGVKKQLKEVLL